ncbi:fimbria/pilus periplasmic chaperone [Enterobacter cloacae complex sp. ECC445]|nr:MULTISPECIES: fimbria/pilus periplasmic chaperone [Enterobacter cloacae complex]MBT1945685.1 fimbria/pilus periplasmic chaperone [Enterobacter hormaechei subsp. xiangfangensis]MCG0456726.1 fimbria/pilus periplasmic chaperone [Enterobacter cloacae complex sp. ECC445]MCK7114407.1 fimbria/pilus periplasmic chaperone [Enterobacter kobei]HAV1854496.1 fimbria/pilus periplasmic chaperone [Enterobacter hormaechei subsp. xiangfangensis]
MIASKPSYFLRCLTLALLALMVSVSSWANVTMTGTRIIYRSDVRSVDVNLANNGNIPFVVQTWFDAGNINDGPESKTNVPFVATPASFRIQARAGQVVRVSHTALRRLPEDRESVFYFNFQQIPPSNAGGSAAEGRNKMLVVLRNRVKLFYRPSRIGSPPANVISTIKASTAREGNRIGVTLTNTLPFYLNLTRIQLNGASGLKLTAGDMVTPYGSRTFWFTRAANSGNNTISLTVINDQGAGISGDIPL